MVEVFLAGVWNKIRSMITGRYVDPHRSAPSMSAWPLPARPDRRRPPAAACCSPAATGLPAPAVLQRFIGHGEDLTFARPAAAARRPAPGARIQARATSRRPSRPTAPCAPTTAAYQALVADEFADWRLMRRRPGDRRPLSFSLAELKALPARTQITRHDCVEGWSAIGEWTGVAARPRCSAGRAEARGALHRLPLRRRSGPPWTAPATTTRASTWSTPSIPRPSWPTP